MDISDDATTTYLEPEGGPPVAVDVVEPISDAATDWAPPGGR